MRAEDKKIKSAIAWFKKEREKERLSEVPHREKRIERYDLAIEALELCVMGARKVGLTKK